MRRSGWRVARLVPLATLATLVPLVMTAGSTIEAPTARAKEPKDPIVELRQSEVDRLKAEAAKVAPLEARIAALQAIEAELRASLLVAQQRLRLAPFEPTTLTRADFAPKLGDAQRLDARDGKARRQPLGKRLGDSARGLVVAFWATWCKPCTSPEELARLGRLKADLAAQGAELVFMAIDELDKVVADPRAGTWLYPLWQRDDGHIAMLPEAFVRAEGLDLPMMLVVAKDGHVRWVRKGALDDRSASEILTAVIRQD